MKILKRPLWHYFIERNKDGIPLCRKCGKNYMSSSRGWCHECELEDFGKIIETETRKKLTITIKRDKTDKGNTSYEPICSKCNCSPCEHMVVDNVFDPDKLWKEMS